MEKYIFSCYFTLVLSSLFANIAYGQYATDTTNYVELVEAGTAALQSHIEANPDVNLLYNPSSAYNNTNYYVYYYPIVTDFLVNVIIDPCRSNAYNCCMNVYGQPEYPALLNPGLEADRVYQYLVIASPTEVAKNYYLVYDDGTSVPSSAQRTPDDYEIWNGTCVTVNDPYDYCAGRNFKYERSPIRPACEDNNSTLDVTAGCYDGNGTYYSYCMTIAYTSNTFIPQCNPTGSATNCGTFLEIHIPHGTPYHIEEDILAQVQLTTQNVSGYYSTVMPLTYMNNASRILCSYTESYLRVGSLVYIKNTAPVCCCPPPFNPTKRTGSFQCPYGPTANGAFAYRAQSIADTLTLDTNVQTYPFCPIDVSSNVDLMMCSIYDVKDRRAYTHECTPVNKTISNVARSWASWEMEGLYDAICPYYDSCALTLNDGKCFEDDLKFSFIGRVGVVTALDNSLAVPVVWVTFNNNRTSYQFDQRHVELQYYKSQYEIWWVVRSPAYNQVLMKKGFNITAPTCTFDTTNNRYFPWTLIKQGQLQDASLFP